MLDLLRHEDPIVRYNAVVSLSFDFRYLQASEPILEILAKDTDIDCRDAAADGLKTLFRNTKDGRVLKALGDAALNDPDEDVRSAAYMAFLEVNGVSDEEHVEMLRGPRLPVDSARISKMLGNS